MQLSQAYVESFIKALAQNKAENNLTIEKIVDLGKDVIHTGIDLPAYVSDIVVVVIKPAEDGAVNIGPYGVPNGYVDSMSVDQSGVFRPGPAFADGELIGSTRGPLLSAGGNSRYIEIPDVSSKEKKLIIQTVGKCDGAKIKVVLFGKKIGEF